MIELYFSQEEKERFLAKRYYIIREIEVWESHNVYHNDVEFSNTKIKVAIKNIDELPKDGERSKTQYTIGIDIVFNRELKQALLNL